LCCTVIFLIEIVASATVPRRARPEQHDPSLRRPRLAVLVPAHNESTGALPTIEDIRRQLAIGDRLVVVADNCSDDTASVATDAGAEVVTRNDPTRIGKGYAIDFGLRYVREDPPEVVIIIDADCRIEDRTLAILVDACVRSDRPIQSLYLMSVPAATTPSINDQMSAYAWRIKNWLRPLGLSALGLPCQLMGTGMAFPWHVIERAELASGHIVEDMKLGLDLAVIGKAPLFCPTALVTSEFPASQAAAQTQRQRWEHGHIGLIRMVPGLLWSAIRRRNLDLFVLALDLAVPPLFLLGLLLTAMAAISGVFALFATTFTPLAISAAGVALYAIAIGLAWRKCGRDLLNSSTLPLLGPYISSKLRSYSRLVTRGAVSEWVRTDRTKID
jgi:cellulose synthase/poly-beta-1,6-N-acetylglucosamine synthase-like glycosyltransferase